MKKSVTTLLSCGVDDGVAVSVQNLAIFIWGFAIIAKGRSNEIGTDMRMGDSGTLFAIKRFDNS